MPEKYYNKLKATKAPRDFLDAVKLSKNNEF